LAAINLNTVTAKTAPACESLLVLGADVLHLAFQAMDTLDMAEEADTAGAASPQDSFPTRAMHAALKAHPQVPVAPHLQVPIQWLGYRDTWTPPVLGRASAVRPDDSSGHTTRNDAGAIPVVLAAAAHEWVDVLQRATHTWRRMFPHMNNALAGLCASLCSALADRLICVPQQFNRDVDRLSACALDRIQPCWTGRTLFFRLYMEVCKGPRFDREQLYPSAVRFFEWMRTHWPDTVVRICMRSVPMWLIGGSPTCAVIVSFGCKTSRCMCAAVCSTDVFCCDPQSDPDRTVHTALAHARVDYWSFLQQLSCDPMASSLSRKNQLDVLRNASRKALFAGGFPLDHVDTPPLRWYE
jgi:hypothetical protein